MCKTSKMAKIIEINVYIIQLAFKKRKNKNRKISHIRRVLNLSFWGKSSVQLRYKNRWLNVKYRDGNTSALEKKHVVIDY